MFDAFPYDEWSDQITTFWTFGVEGDTGTIILTILGVYCVRQLPGVVLGEDVHQPRANISFR